VRRVWPLCLLCLLLWAGPPPARAAEERPYRIATVAWAGWSPLHVAEEQGFWNDLGLRVEVRNYDDPIVILEAVKAGKVDFAMGRVGSLVGVYLTGTPVLALAATNWSHGGDRLIVHRGESIRQCKGKPLGVFLDQPSCLYFLGLALRREGLRLSDFRIVEMNPSDMTEQFVAGRLRILVSYDPWALDAVRQGDGETAAASDDFEGCIPECIWGYRERLLRIPPEEIRKVLQGWIRAVVWTQDPANQAAYMDILNRRTFHDRRDYAREELAAILAGVRIHGPDALRECNRTGGGLERYLNDLHDFLEDNGRLGRTFRPSHIFDNRWVMDALLAETGAPAAAPSAAPGGGSAAAPGPPGPRGNGD